MINTGSIGYDHSHHEDFSVNDLNGINNKLLNIFNKFIEIMKKHRVLWEHGIFVRSCMVCPTDYPILMLYCLCFYRIFSKTLNREAITATL